MLRVKTYLKCRHVQRRNFLWKWSLRMMAILFWPQGCGPLLTISWWRHQMEIFFMLLALCAGNSPLIGNSPHKGQWRGVLMFLWSTPWINDWVNNREAGDLRSHRVYYDVIVIYSNSSFLGFYSLSGKTSQHQILWRFEGVRLDDCIARKFGSAVFDVPVKFQDDVKSLNQSVAVSRFPEILR